MLLLAGIVQLTEAPPRPRRIDAARRTREAGMRRSIIVYFELGDMD